MFVVAKQYIAFAAFFAKSVMFVGSKECVAFAAFFAVSVALVVANLLRLVALISIVWLLTFCPT